MLGQFARFAELRSGRQICWAPDTFVTSCMHSCASMHQSRTCVRECVCAYVRACVSARLRACVCVIVLVLLLVHSALGTYVWQGRSQPDLQLLRHHHPKMHVRACVLGVRHIRMARQIET